MEKLIRGRAGFANLRLHVSIAAQLLEGVFAFLVLGAAGAFAGLGVAEFFDDLADVLSVGFDRKGAGMATDAPIPLPVAVGEIERDDRNRSEERRVGKECRS